MDAARYRDEDQGRVVRQSGGVAIGQIDCRSSGGVACGGAGRIDHLIEAVKKELIEQRNEVFPNTDQHIDLSIKFWTASHARILQAAIERELITQDWITKTGNYRNCQHLFFIEKAYLLAPERVK